MLSYVILASKSFECKVVNLININASLPWEYGFQTPYSPIAEGIMRFHDELGLILSFILFFVLYILYTCLKHFNIENKNYKNNYSASFIHHPTLEIVWTIIPALLLIAMAVPSFSLLYSVDEIKDEPAYTIKIIGHQWYWSYETMSLAENTEAYSGKNIHGEINFDSYLLADDELNSPAALSNIRLLTVDNHLYIPTTTDTRLIITAADVLHSWAIPSLGVKLDACPGRLNQISLFIERPGLYYGQCSEICGVNHGFMPIGVISKHFFLSNKDQFNMLFEPFSMAVGEAED